MLVLASQSAASLPTYLLAIVVVASWAAWSDVFRLRLLWLVLITIVYFALSVFWSDRESSRVILSELVRGFLVFCFVVAFAEIQMRGQVQLLLRRAMALVGSVTALAAISVFVITAPADGRLNGLGQLDAHVIAALVYSVSLVLALQMLVRESSPYWRAVAIVAILILGVTIFLSGSRNAWVSAIIGFGTLLLAEYAGDKQRFLASAASLLVFLGLLLIVLAMNDDVRALLMPRGLSFRPEIWGAVIERTIAGGYWFGLGVGTDDNVRAGGITFLHPHSLYISAFFQGGLVGLLLLCSVIISALKELLHHFDHADAKLALGILGVALPAYLLDGHEIIDKIGSTWFMLWLPVAIALGLRWQRVLQSN